MVVVMLYCTVNDGSVLMYKTTLLSVFLTGFTCLLIIISIVRYF